MSSSSLPTDTHRPPSVHSVASNSSAASGVSLLRRPRTMRTRSKTVTGTPLPPRPSDADQPFPVSPVVQTPPHPDRPVVQEPQQESAGVTLSAPPLRMPERIDTGCLQPNNAPPSSISSGTVEATYVEMPQVSVLSAKSNLPKTPRPTLPAIETVYKPPPSAFSRDPALTSVVNARDSVSTQQSGTSSSIYPPSTSTASGPESPLSPPSTADQHGDIFNESTDNHDLAEYDNDDVAYRLRLLVKNSYFLPPAHLKPSLADLAPSPTSTTKPYKTGSPTFLDIFRVGKSRSKSSNPTGTSPTTPILRTTSDSITLLRSQPRTSTQSPRISPGPLSASSRGRVVVVRELMSDLVAAAKQAEHELKARGARPEQVPQKAPAQPTFDDVIDPTDAVDLPPPAPDYPFAVQASALHGLGVMESVGAAALAERLPPPHSLSMSASYDAEDDWRKALLHEAVHHSLDTTPEMSSFSHIQGSSTPLPSPRSKTTDMSARGPSPAASVGNAVKVQQRIIDPTLIESPPTRISPMPKKPEQNPMSSPEQAGQSKTPTSRQSFLPVRAETPSGPMTPLTPAPRKQNANPFHSLSHTDLQQNYAGQAEDDPRAVSPGRTLRRSQSSPMLSDAYESPSGRAMVMTPPPAPTLSIYSQAFSMVSGTSFHTSQEGQITSSFTSSDSWYSVDMPRDSVVSLTMNARARPSISEYSQVSLSPTSSAFQDHLSRDGYMSSSSAHHASGVSAELMGGSYHSRDSRYSTMSPPPRRSSSVAHVALSPAPRGPPRQVYPRPVGIYEASSTAAAESAPVEIVVPEPTTPISKGHGDSSRSHSPITIHSAPPPASPTSFFDTIQTQHNAMDDLASSSDDELSGRMYGDPRSRTVSNVTSTSPRPPIMRLGNHSTPYVSPSRPLDGVHGIASGMERRRPVANVPVRQPFFTDRKNDGGQGPWPASALDFYRYTQEQQQQRVMAVGDARRPALGEQVPRSQKAQESLRKLDGMLIQHMETERDTIKRIATTVKLGNAASGASMA